MREYIKSFANIFNYKGRASRREYWVPVLLNMAISWFFVSVIMMIVFSAIGSNETLESIDGISYFGTGRIGALIIIGGIFAIYAVTITLAQISLTVRRLHDMGKSGWWYLLAIPLSCLCGAGGIILFVFTCMDSVEDNMWGENPKNTMEYPNNISIVVAVVLAVVSFILYVSVLMGYMVNIAKISYEQQKNQSSVTIDAEDENGNSIDVIPEDETEDEESVDTTQSGVSGLDEEEQDSQETTETSNQVNIQLDEASSLSLTCPAGFEISYSGESYVCFSNDDQTINFASSYMDKKQVQECLKNNYNAESGDFEDAIVEKSVCNKKTEVDGHTVYYSKIVQDMDGELYTAYYMYEDIGAQYLLEVTVSSFETKLTDEDAFAYAKVKLN